MDATTRRVVLVGCSKRKTKVEPGRKLPARELYAASHLFRLQLRHAQSLAQDVFILSAMHGLVDLNQPLPSYNRKLADLSPEERARFGDNVIRDLFLRFGHESLEIVILAGSPYVTAVADAARSSARSAMWKVRDPFHGMDLFARRRVLQQEAKLDRCEYFAASAIAMEQSPGRIVYLFAADGKQVPRFAAISRVRRGAQGVTGYQRPEVLAHVANITDYLESERPMIPNAIVIAFSSQVSFVPSVPGKLGPGQLFIPMVKDPEQLPGFVVDGQQRLAAVRESKLERFPLAVSAFITDDPEEQAEQFLLVNSAKPLPKGLIYELLPSTRATLPPALEARKLPARLLERLNTSEGSPLKGLIATITNPDGVAKDTSFLETFENSLRDGALHRFWRQGNPDLDAMEARLRAWWGAVQDSFPKEWGKKPKESRLFHGAGIIALGFLMDTVLEHLEPQSDGAPVGSPPERAALAKEIARVKDACAWSSGAWDFGPGQQRPWNQLQNTRQDKERLARLLTLLYQERRRTSRRGRK